MLFSVSNTIATIPGIVAPILTGMIVSDPPHASQWQIVFLIAVGWFLFGSVIYVAWADGEPQPKLNVGIDDDGGEADRRANGAPTGVQDAA